MASLGDVFLRVRPDTKGFAKETQGQVKKGFGGIAGVAAKAFAAAGVATFLKSSVKAFSEAEAAQNKLSFAFEKFPKLADISRESLDKLNTKLAENTRFDDDAAAAAQGLLATFGLTGTEITKLTPLLADFAARTGKDLPDAAATIGKALKGQGRALKAIGIDFKITGDKAADLARLQDLLSEKVGGFATREGKQAAGQAAILKNQFGELQETIGGALLPVLRPLIASFIQFLKFIRPVAPILLAVVAVLFTAVKITKAFTAIQLALNVALSANPIGLIIIAIAALVVGIVIAYKKSQTFRNIVQALFEALKAVGNFIKNVLVFAFKLSPLGLLIANFDKLKRGLQLLFDLLKKVLAPFRELGKVLGTIGRGIAKGLDFLLPGSPPPLAVGIKASADALKAFQALAKRTTLPGFSSGVPALAFAGGAGARGFSGSITVNQVANDPEATARAVAARLGQRSTR